MTKGKKAPKLKYLRISQWTQNKKIKKFYQGTINCESSGFPRIYHSCSCITTLRNSFKIFKYWLVKIEVLPILQVWRKNTREDRARDQTKLISEQSHWALDFKTFQKHLHVNSNARRKALVLNGPLNFLIKLIIENLGIQGFYAFKCKNELL